MSPADRESPVVKLQKRAARRSVPGLMLGLSAAVLPALGADVWLNGADPDTQNTEALVARVIRRGFNGRRELARAVLLKLWCCRRLHGLMASCGLL